MADLNQHQFGAAQPMSTPNMRAETAADFHGQMRRFRLKNPHHPGVQDYHRSQEEGFMAHVDGLLAHAGSVDNAGEPLLEDGRYATYTYERKRRENEKTARLNPHYDNDLVTGLANGTVDPIHVAMGHDMASDSKYGGRVQDHQVNNAWIGNGNHRLVRAHQAGIKRIKAQKFKEGTGQDGEVYMSAAQISDMHAANDRQDLRQAGMSHYDTEGNYQHAAGYVSEGNGTNGSYGPHGSYHPHAPLRDEQFGAGR